MFLQSTLFIMCDHILCRVQLEVDEVLGTRGEVTEEDLEKLQYTEQVCIYVQTFISRFF